MATAYFDPSGICVCIEGSGSELQGHSDLPYSAPVQDGTKTGDVYFDVQDQTVKNKKNFSVNVLRGKILNIPVGTIASTVYGTFVVMDGELEIESTYPGARIRVVLVHPHYRDKTVEVASL